MGTKIVPIITAPLAESPSAPPSTHQSSLISRFAASDWSLDSLAQNTAWRTDQYWISERAKHYQYAFRMLRYWYIERLLNIERERLGRPLSVLEIGVDRGQMKTFIDGVPRPDGSERLYSAWDAADVKPQQEALDSVGYGLCHQVNLDDSDSLARLIGQLKSRYDVIVLLHVLEHLNKPERAVTFLSAVLKSDGIVLGGFPVLPSGIARLRERQLQKTAEPFGHVSAFSPRRVRKMAERSGLTVDYASGAFAVRASGSPLEHTSSWLRFNIAFGALFPGWPGEIYWQLRKPAAHGAAR
jgi:SAM-dependent methyltransferase